VRNYVVVGKALAGVDEGEVIQSRELPFWEFVGKVEIGQKVVAEAPMAPA
jgi:hypothetical protein